MVVVSLFATIDFFRGPFFDKNIESCLSSWSLSLSLNKASRILLILIQPSRDIVEKSIRSEYDLKILE